MSHSLRSLCAWDHQARKLQSLTVSLHGFYTEVYNLTAPPWNLESALHIGLITSPWDGKEVGEKRRNHCKVVILSLNLKKEKYVFLFFPQKHLSPSPASLDIFFFLEIIHKSSESQENASTEATDGLLCGGGSSYSCWDWRIQGWLNSSRCPQVITDLLRLWLTCTVAHSPGKLQKSHVRGTWVAQVVKHLSLGFGFGCELDPLARLPILACHRHYVRVAWYWLELLNALYWGPT